MYKSVNIGNIILPEFPLLLAPMEDVSDPPFRAVCKDNGADLMYTEFISSEGLIRDAMKSRQKLDVFDYEKPVGIQIFGGDEEAMAMSASNVERSRPLQRPAAWSSDCDCESTGGPPVATSRVPSADCV